MKSLQRVLAYVPSGTPQDVLTAGLRLTRRRGGHLELLDVVSDKPTLMAQLLAHPPPEDFVGRLLADRRGLMESRVRELDEAGYSVTGSVVVGVPVGEIVRAVTAHEIDLVLVAPEFSRRVYGGTTLRVLRNAPCPVWVVRDAPLRIRRVLAAVDPTETGTVRDTLNRQIVELAVSVAVSERAELDVLHAWNTTALPAGSSARVWDDWQRAARSELKRRIGELLEPYRDQIDATIHLTEGDPAESVVHVAREREADVVVIGTVCRTGVAGFFIGNTAEEVLQEIDCSVLAVKPAGFVSPIAIQAEEEGS